MADACTYGLLANILEPPIASPVKEAGAKPPLREVGESIEVEAEEVQEEAAGE